MKTVMNGREVEATPVEFTATNEPWNIYQLGDGTRMRLKFVLARVVRTEERTASGQPIYCIEGQPVFAVDEAEERSARVQ